MNEMFNLCSTLKPKTQQKTTSRRKKNIREQVRRAVSNVIDNLNLDLVAMRKHRSNIESYTLRNFDTINKALLQRDHPPLLLTAAACTLLFKQVSKFPEQRFLLLHLLFL